MNHRAAWRSATCGGLIACLVLGARPSVAQDPSQKAAAESLFDAGKALMKDKNYADACPKFAESDRLDPGLGVKLFLADCYEQAGKTASAWTTFRDAAALASQRKDSKREKIARERSANLENKLSKLTIQVSAEASAISGLEIKCDGHEVTRPLWGVPVATDPGEHVIEAKAPGRTSFSAKMTLSDQKQETFTIPMLAAVVVSTPPVATSAPVAVTASAPPIASSAPKKTPIQRADPPPSSTISQSNVGLIFGGIGLVSLGVSAIFGAKVKSNVSDANEKYCNTKVPGTCTQQGLTLLDDARTARTISYVSLGMGGALLATGAVIYLTAPSAPNNNTGARVWVSPVADQRGSGVQLGGAW